MKKTEKLFLTVCAFFIVSILNAKGVYTIRFNTDDINFYRRDSFDIINMKGCISAGDIGTPLLPHRRVEILIPPDKTFGSIKILNRVLIPINERLKLYPAQPPVQLNQTSVKNRLEINKEIYNSSKVFPERSVIFCDEENIVGKTLLSFDIIPIVYIPKEGKVFLIKEITFQVNLKNNHKLLIQPKKRTAFSEHFANEIIKKRIFNKKELSTTINETEIINFNNQNPSAQLTKPSFEDLPKDFIIITVDSLSQSFESLAEIKMRNGIITEIVTTEWLNDNYSGRDLPERIRNFLKDAYVYWGATWVLLGGDVTVVPTRFVDFKSWQYNGLVPTDLYFSDMDGDWDANGNGIFGEYVYGSNIDSVEGSPDIFVGRIPVETVSEVEDYIEKVSRYEENPDTSYIPKVLFLGASICQGGTDGWGALTSEHIIENYIPSNIMVHRVYAPQIDTLQEPPRWSGDEFLNSTVTISNINQGYNIINHIDHGAYDAIGTGVMNGGGYFHWYDADALTNSERPSILWSIACSPNAFDLNSVSEHFVNSKGGLAFIGNSRTGWTSQAFQDYTFFESIFSDSILNLGAAFATTLYNSFYYKIVMNLLGDPSIFIWTEIPKKLSINYQKTLIVPIDSIAFFITKQGVPIKNARIVLTKANEGIKRIALTDIDGKAVIYLKCKIPGKLNISVSHPNSFPYFDSVTVLPSEKPYLSFKKEALILRRGIKNKIQAVLENTGRGTAERVQAIVSTVDPYMSIKDSILKFGNIPPFTSKLSSNYFVLKISKDCPVKRTIKLNCRMFDRNNNEWFDTLLFYTGDVLLSYRGHSSISINSANSMDTIMKTVLIPSIRIKNSGDFTGKEINIYLRTENPQISLIDSVVHINAIPAHKEIESNDGFSFQSYYGLDAEFTIVIKDIMGNCFSQKVEFNAPQKVDSIGAISKQLSIKIMWNGSEDNDIIGYYIYRKDGDIWKKITDEPIPFISYEDFNITQGHLYSYSVSAVDSSFNESSLSESIIASSNPPLLPGWPAYIGQGGYSVYSGRRFYDISSPAFGDINGDGKDEVVVGSNDNKVYIYNDDGTNVEGWPKDIGFRIENSPAVCDLDNDGVAEVIIGGGIFDSVSVYIFRGDGSIFLPGVWPKTDGGYPLTSPVVEDIDGDGKYEIGIGCSDNKVYFWKLDGNLVSGWPVTVSSPVNIATADIDNDTENEVVIASSGGTINVFNPDGTQKEGWPQTPGGVIYTGLALADLDNDGMVEVIVGTGNKKLFVYLPDGTLKQGWPISVGDRIGGIPAVGDVDGEMGLEIAVSTIANQMYVFKHTGELLFSKGENRIISNYYISPLLVDINNDNKKEMIINTFEGSIYAYDWLGRYVCGYPIFYGNGTFSSSAIGDIDRDGNLNLILKGSDKKMYVWDLNNSKVTEQEAWYRARANNRNTCYYNGETSDFTGVKEGIKRRNIKMFFSPPYPNPFSNKVSIRYCAGQKVEKMELKIYDVSGRFVKSLSQTTDHSAQFTVISWDGKAKGKEVSSGIYFIKLFIISEKKEQLLTRKIIKLSTK